MRVLKPVYLTILLLATVTVLLNSCNNEAGADGYDLGEYTWQIALPKNYVHHANDTDTSDMISICGPAVPGEMIQLFEVQEGDTAWVDPIPNVFTAFHSPAGFLKGSSVDDCGHTLEETYQYILGMSNVNFTPHFQSIKIDGISFTQLDNEIYSAQGKFTHGDVHFIGKVGTRILHVQISYNDKKQRDVMVKTVTGSTFTKK